MAHVDMPLGPDYTLFEFDRASRADQHAAGGAGNLATGPHWQVDAQRDAVGESEFHLRGWSGGAEHPDRRQHPSLRPDDHHRLFGGVEAVLIEILLRREGSAGAEKLFNVLVSEVAVPG